MTNRIQEKLFLPSKRDTGNVCFPRQRDREDETVKRKIFLAVCLIIAVCNQL